MAERERDYSDYGERRGKDQARDIVLKFNEFCWVWDKTTGTIYLYVGPTILSPSINEVLVTLTNGNFREVSKDEGIQHFIESSTGEYVILKNPTREIRDFKSGKNQFMELQTGKRIVKPGPESFPLWPGQEAEVVPGHRLQHDEYLVVRVYDEVAEGQEAIQTAGNGHADEEKIKKETSLRGKPLGTEDIITGEKVRFYIPPTGVEVVKDEHGRFIRKAVILSEMEYCATIDEKGEVHYHKGPGVVFPRSPFEHFLEIDGSRIFEAYTLTKDSGIHLLVIKSFDKATGEKFLPREFGWPEKKERFEAGEEIVIKGIENIFFPFDNIKVIGTIKAIPIPESEGIYVQEKETGKIKVVRGPKMYIPDPRREKHVTRCLDPDTTSLYRGEAVFVTYEAGKDQSKDSKDREKTKGSSIRSDLERIQQHGEYDFRKAVDIYVPVGMAVMVVGESGDSVKRRVIKGPDRVILEYNEWLEVMALSTGKPKSTDILLKTCFLQVEGNKVSDIVTVETADHCFVRITLSFRVSFINEPEKWFNVSNYVKLLYDNLRSRIAAEAKKHSIEEYFKNYTETIRDCILGKKEDKTPRAGRCFDENNMKVYDVEVLEFEIEDAEIRSLLIHAERDAVVQGIQKQSEQRRLDTERTKQDVQRQIDQEIHMTKMAEMERTRNKNKHQNEMDLEIISYKMEQAMQQEERNRQLTEKKLETERTLLLERAGAEKEAQVVRNDLLLSKTKAEIDAEGIRHREQLEHQKSLDSLEIELLKANVDAVVKQNASVTPDFIAALQTLGDKELAAKLSENFNLLSAFKGSSIAEVAGTFLTQLPNAGAAVDALIKRNGNKTEKMETKEK